MKKSHYLRPFFFCGEKILSDILKFLVRWVSAKCFKVKWQLINVNGKIYILHRWNDAERVQPMNSAAVSDEDRICSGLSSGLCQRCRQRGSPWNEPQNIYRSLCNRNITNKKKTQTDRCEAVGRSQWMPAHSLTHYVPVPCSRGALPSSNIYTYMHVCMCGIYLYTALNPLNNINY